MRRTRTASWLAIPAAVAVLATACGGNEEAGGGEADRDGEFSVYATEPENPLIPGDTNEVGGGRVVDEMFAMLKGYDEDYSPYDEMAESIESNDDSSAFTITIKEGWEFHDGEEVTADNFVDAWNYVVNNGQKNSSFFENIEGYDEASPEDSDEDEDGDEASPEDEDEEDVEPADEEMSGLEVIDDYTFEVTLNEPFAIFPTTLGYSAFAPLPEAFFDDPEAFEDEPIGNGPLEFVEHQPNQHIKLTRYDDYQGEDDVNFQDVTFKIYQERDPAYQDLLSGNLDFMEDMPPSALADGKYEDDFGDRTVTADLLSHEALTFPLYADESMDDPKLHKAISMAIDREEIAEQIFDGTRDSMTGWVPSELPGATEEGACGEDCTHQPEKAQELLDETDFEGPLTISSNADGGHKEWIEAVCGNIENSLDIECHFDPSTSFGEFRSEISAEEMTGPFRTGWVADYPSAENFLSPIYRTGGAANDGDYSNPDFDAKMDEANAASDEDEANELYREAEDMLRDDMPVIPLWTQIGAAAHSENIDDVVLTPERWIDFSQVEVVN